jgi:hypothetical protein
MTFFGRHQPIWLRRNRTSGLAADVRVLDSWAYRIGRSGLGHPLKTDAPIAALRWTGSRKCRQPLVTTGPIRLPAKWTDRSAEAYMNDCVTVSQ